MKRAPLLLAAFVLAGCSALWPDAGLSIEAAPPILRLTNEAEETIYYVVVEAETATLIDLNPNVEEWPALAAGEQLAIPYEEIMGYDDQAEGAFVFWSTGEGYEREEVGL